MVTRGDFKRARTVLARLDAALDDALQGPRAEGRVDALGREGRRSRTQRRAQSREVER